MPTLKKRKLNRGLWWSDDSKTWHYEIKVNNQPYKGDTGHAIFGEAQDWKAAKKRTIKDAEVGILPPAPPPAPAITLAELVALYRLKRGGTDKKETAVTSHTLAAIELSLRLHWKGLAATPIDQITTAEVEDMRQRYLEGRGRRSKGGANKMVARLITVLAWAVRRGLIKELPFKLDKLKFQKQVKAIVWPEQQRPFLRASRACRNADARLAMLGCLTMGFREAEATGMRWEWFDWTAQIYRVGKAKDMEPRAIPMHPVFRRVMRTRWLYQGKPHQGLALKTKKGEPHFAGYLKKPVANTARRMKIVGLHPHWLRASAATAWWESGASIAKIMLWLGHEDAATTMLYIVKRDLDGRQIQVRAAQAGGWPVPVESPEKKPESPKRRKKAA